MEPSAEKSVTWTETQAVRLRELGGDDFLAETFSTAKERDSAFFAHQKELGERSRLHLDAFRETIRRPLLCRIEDALVDALTAAGFVQVVTPTIISKDMLARMTIDESRALFSQVFWLDKNKCLRPMLAPGLYEVSRDLLRLWKGPVRMFEIGSCFRKESQGATHLNEFTMLDMVEWNVELDERKAHLQEFADLVMKAAGLKDFKLETEDSTVYGDTVDVTYHGVEAASCAFGPHPLDDAWGIHTSWVGLGFGLERLAMLREGGHHVKSYSRSLTFLDGVRLNVS